MAILGGNGPFVRMYAMPRTMGVTFEMKFGGLAQGQLEVASNIPPRGVPGLTPQPRFRISGFWGG